MEEATKLRRATVITQQCSYSMEMEDGAGEGDNIRVYKDNAWVTLVYYTVEPQEDNGIEYSLHKILKRTTIPANTVLSIQEEFAD